MGLVIKNIKGIVQAGLDQKKYLAGTEMAQLPVVENGWLLTEGELIKDLGRMEEYQVDENEHNVIDASGRYLFPSFCDSHTHIVYAGSREIEYTDKIKGLSYEEIARRGGGILNSAKLLRETSEDELYAQSIPRIDEIIHMGTGAVEIKSGYGLNLESELKMLRVIKRIADNSRIEVKATFLGAHSLPDEFRNNRKKYIDLIIKEMIPAVAAEGLAEFIDVFCDKGFFSVKETERILNTGAEFGLVPKLHANELDYSGGIQAGVKFGALSVDHLEYTGDEEIECLRGSDTMPTLLPGASFFLGLVDPPARKMIEAGLPVALASDYNPGSSPSGNMKLIMSLGCVRLRMLPEEVINAVTINSAYAMGLSETHGSIVPGKRASFFITGKIPSYQFFPYAYGSNLIDIVVLKGEVVD